MSQAQLADANLFWKFHQSLDKMLTSWKDKRRTNPTSFPGSSLFFPSFLIEEGRERGTRLARTLWDVSFQQLFCGAENVCKSKKFWERLKLKLGNNALDNIYKQLRFPLPGEYWCRVNKTSRVARTALLGSGVFAVDEVGSVFNIRLLFFSEQLVVKLEIRSVGPLLLPETIGLPIGMLLCILVSV